MTEPSFHVPPNALSLSSLDQAELKYEMSSQIDSMQTATVISAVNEAQGQKHQSFIALLNLLQANSGLSNIATPTMSRSTCPVFDIQCGVTPPTKTNTRKRVSAHERSEPAKRLQSSFPFEPDKKTTCEENTNPNKCTTNKGMESNCNSSAMREVLLRGVTQRQSGKWQAQLYYAGKSRYIGVFDSRERAALAYEMARDKVKADASKENMSTCMKAIEKSTTVSEIKATTDAEKQNNQSSLFLQDLQELSSVIEKTPYQKNMRSSGTTKTVAAARISTFPPKKRLYPPATVPSSSFQCLSTDSNGGIITSSFGVRQNWNQYSRPMVLNNLSAANSIMGNYFSYMQQPVGNWQANTFLRHPKRETEAVLKMPPTFIDPPPFCAIIPCEQNTFSVVDGAAKCTERNHHLEQNFVAMKQNQKCVTSKKLKLSPPPVSARDQAAATAQARANIGTPNANAAALAAAILRGVTQRPSGKWQAQLYYSGKSRYIGVFDTREKAALAYEVAREKLKASQEDSVNNDIAESANAKMIDARKEALSAVYLR